MPIEKIQDIAAFADMLGVPKFALTRCIFQSDFSYKQFQIPKKSGHGYRLICAPSQQMKGYQRWITVFILRKVDVSRYSTAFREGCSIIRNSTPHIGMAFVHNTDIKSFFPSITIKRVVGLFRSLGYCKEVAFALGRLTTYKGRLPQGAPSSPDIGNLICRGLDARLAGLCERRGWKYTRYCDDITISGDTGFSRGIQDAIRQTILDEGFLINNQKTRTTRRGSRQVVTGLVVNDKVALPRYKRRRLRALFHQASLTPIAFQSRIGELAGRIAFLEMISPADPAIPKYKDVLGKVAEVCG